jgi:hypothetical protein
MGEFWPVFLARFMLVFGRFWSVSEVVEGRLKLVGAMKGRDMAG